MEDVVPTIVVYEVGREPAFKADSYQTGEEKPEQDARNRKRTGSKRSDDITDAAEQLYQQFMNGLRNGDLSKLYNEWWL